MNGDCLLYKAVAAISIVFVIVFLFTGCAGNEPAHAYQNSAGEVIYCSNKQDDNLRDFEYLGEVSVPESQIRFCALA